MAVAKQASAESAVGEQAVAVQPHNNILSIFLGVLIAVLVAAIAAVGYVGYQAYRQNVDEVNAKKAAVSSENIYPNIFINGIHVGDMTKAEALNAVTTTLSPALTEQTIEVVHNDNKLSFTLEEFGARYDFSEAVDQAYDYGRDSAMTLDERYNLVTGLNQQPYQIEANPAYAFDPSDIEAKLAPMADMVYIAPVDATIKRENGQFYITPEQEGLQFVMQPTADGVMQLLEQKQGGQVPAVTEPIAPNVYGADLIKCQSLIGTFTTIATGTGNRIKNVDNALSKINDVTLLPGEVFSTNAALGEMTVDNGYAIGQAYLNGKLVDDIGGGVCQVSSTLYDAVLYAELNVVERQNHSQMVGYMEWGFDATLAGDYIDFKFENDTDYPVFIEGVKDGNQVIVNIYGYEVHGAGHEVQFSNEFVGTTAPPEPIITEDPNLPTGTRNVTSPAKTGYTYNVYKTVYENGKAVETVKINTSRYRALPEEVTVGTGPAVADPAMVPPTSAEQAAANITNADPAPIQPGETEMPPVAPAEPIITEPIM